VFVGGEGVVRNGEVTGQRAGIVVS
jgi:hypothetical protein